MHACIQSISTHARMMCIYKFTMIIILIPYRAQRLFMHTIFHICMHATSISYTQN